MAGENSDFGMMSVIEMFHQLRPRHSEGWSKLRVAHTTDVTQITDITTSFVCH
jgi:hypothetical protein